MYRTILLATVLSFCSMMYELLVAKGFLLITSNVVTAQTVPIGLYLLGIGFGVLWQTKRQQAQTSFLKVELSLCALGLLVPFYAYGANAFIEVFLKAHFSNIFFIKLIVFSIAPLSIGLLTGREFSLLIERGKKSGVNTNLILMSTYFGNLIGGLAFPLFLYEPLGLLGCCILISSLNLIVAIFVTYEPWSIKRLTLFLTVSFPICILALDQQHLSQNLKSLSYIDISTPEFKMETFKNLWGFFRKEAPLVESYRSKYQDIDLVNYGVEGVTLFLNRKPQFSTKNYISYHQSMLEGFVNLHGKVPVEALILGGGDGILARYLLDRGVEKIKIVDLDPFITKLASSHAVFLELNLGALLDKRVEVVNGDAFSYMINSDKKFEAVFIDFPLPTHLDLSKLYSSEFYRSVYQRLSPNGSAIFDSPANIKFQFGNKKLVSKSLNLIAKTLIEAGIDRSLTYGPFEAFVFFTKQKKVPSFHHEEFPLKLPGYVFMNMVEFDNFVDVRPSLKANSIFKPVRFE